jgi:ABC-2 type transport system permease protein
LFFPIVLIWIFGSLSGNGNPSVDVAFDKEVDTANFIYPVLKSIPVLRFIDTTKRNKEDELKKGRITAIMSIIRSSNDSPNNYTISLRTSTASQKDLQLLKAILKTATYEIDERMHPDRKPLATITETVSYRERPYHLIDFFLPGMIGFALIGSAVFGVAFTFFSLKDTLVLKRMYSTPVNRLYILLGEGLSKVLFNLTTVVVLIVFGYFVYHFTLAHGLVTFFDMLTLSFIALLSFIGVGLFISSIAKNQNVIPVYANLFMFPQYFLSGTFFQKSALPDFLQPIIKFLPLTALNDAMRNVAFEGTSLFDCREQIAILLGWSVIIYIGTAKIFRWE